MKVDIKLGYTCNNNCIHCVVADNRDLCYARGREEDLNTQEFKHELLDSRNRGYNVVVFTGGEPTIRNDLAHLMQYAHDLGYKVDMQTNGRRFCSRDFAKAISGITNASYCIALHGHNEAIHDTITAVRGSFHETVAAIKNLVSLGQEVVGKLVLSKVNYAHILPTCRFLDELGVRDITITFPHALGNARRYFFDVVPRYTDTVGFLWEALDFCRKNKIIARTEAYPFCLMKGFEDHVIELFFPETHTELKQLGHEDYVLDWSKKKVENKMKFPDCVRCCYCVICEGPWFEYPEKYGSDEFRPVPGERILTHQEFINRLGLNQ